MCAYTVLHLFPSNPRTSRGKSGQNFNSNLILFENLFLGHMRKTRVQLTVCQKASELMKESTIECKKKKGCASLQVSKLKQYEMPCLKTYSIFIWQKQFRTLVPVSGQTKNEQNLLY